MYHLQDGMEQDRLHLTSWYSGFWWEGSQALPWKCIVQEGRLFWLDTPETIHLHPGKICQLSIALTGFSIGAAAVVFLRLDVPDGTMELPLFTLRPKGSAAFQRTFPLYTQTPAELSLRVSGLYGICLLEASLEGAAFPV